MATRVNRPTLVPLTHEIIDRWSGVPTSIAVDIFAGHILIDPAIRPLRAFVGGRRLVGSAVTALCTGTDYGAVHHAIAVANAGDIIVVEAGGRDSPAVIGELLSGAARLKGVAGVIVNGAVRDSGRLRQWTTFRYSRGTSTRVVHPRWTRVS